MHGLVLTIYHNCVWANVREKLGLKKNQTLLKAGTFNGVDSELKFNPNNYSIKKSNKTITTLNDFRNLIFLEKKLPNCM